MVDGRPNRLSVELLYHLLSLISALRETDMALAIRVLTPDYPVPS